MVALTPTFHLSLKSWKSSSIKGRQSTIVLTTWIFFLVSTCAWAQFDPDHYFQLAESKKTLGERMHLASGMFLGAPYVLFNLGEGPGSTYDWNPIYDFSSFDCTTYVETVLALAHSQNLSEYKEKLTNIRYENGEISFVTRNHFPSLEWFPNNIASGYIEELTLAIYPQADLATAIIDKKSWYEKLPKSRLRIPELDEQEEADLLEKLHSEGQAFSKTLTSIRYIPTSVLLRNLNLIAQIPDGSIVAIVTQNNNLKNKIGTNMNVSHLGLVIWENGVAYFREASQTKKIVADKRLSDELYEMSLSFADKGIAIYHAF